MRRGLEAQPQPMSLGEQTLAWRRVEKGIHRLGAACLANEFLDSQALAPAEITEPDDGDAPSSPLTSRRHFDEHVMLRDASSCARLTQLIGLYIHGPAAPWAQRGRDGDLTLVSPATGAIRMTVSGAQLANEAWYHDGCSTKFSGVPRH